MFQKFCLKKSLHYLGIYFSLALPRSVALTIPTAKLPASSYRYVFDIIRRYRSYSFTKSPTIQVFHRPPEFGIYPTVKRNETPFRPKLAWTTRLPWYARDWLPGYSHPVEISRVSGQAGRRYVDCNTQNETERDFECD